VKSPPKSLNGINSGNTKLIQNTVFVVPK
jgi:hypothetical protein